MFTSNRNPSSSWLGPQFSSNQSEQAIPGLNLSSFLTSAIANTLQGPSSSPGDTRHHGRTLSPPQSDTSPSYRRGLLREPAGLLPEPVAEASSAGPISNTSSLIPVRSAVSPSPAFPSEVSRIQPPATSFIQPPPVMEHKKKEPLLATESWRNNESWRSETKPENRDRSTMEQVRGDQSLSLAEKETTPRNDLKIRPAEPSGAFSLRGSSQAKPSPWSNTFGSKDTDIRTLKSNKEFLRIDLKSGQVKKSRWEKSEDSSSSEKISEKVTDYSPDIKMDDNAEKEDILSTETESNSSPTKTKIDGLKELLEEAEAAVSELGEELVKEKASESPKNTEDGFSLQLSGGEEESFVEEDVIAQIKKEKELAAEKAKKEAELSKSWELKIEEALKKDSGMDEGSSDSPAESPGKCEPASPSFEEQEEVIGEETPILQKYESSPRTEEEHPRRSRPGLIFKGCRRMELKFAKYRAEDITKYFGKKRVRKVLVNQPEVRLDRLSCEKLEKYCGEEKKNKEKKVGEKREKERSPEDDKKVLVKKRKVVEDASQPAPTETPPSEPKPYIERLLEKNAGEKKPKKSKFEDLINRRKGLKGEVPEDPRTEETGLSREERKPKKEVSEHLKFQSLWKDMPKFKIQKKTDVAPPKKKGEERARKTIPKKKEQSSREVNKGGIPRRSRSRERDRRDGRSESWRRSKEESWRKEEQSITESPWLKPPPQVEQRQQTQWSRKEPRESLWTRDPSKESRTSDPWDWERKASAWRRDTSWRRSRSPERSVTGWGRTRERSPPKKDPLLATGGLAVPQMRPRGYGRGAGLLNRPDDKYVSPLERRAMTAGARRPEDRYKKAFRPKVEEKAPQPPSEEKKEPTPTDTAMGSSPVVVSPQTEAPTESEPFHVVGNFRNMVTRRRGGLLDDSSAVPEKNIDPAAFVESLSDEEPEQKKDDYDLAADYLMAGSGQAPSTSAVQQKPVVGGNKETADNDHDTLVQTALTLMDKFGLSVDDILNQSQRAKDVIAKLQREGGGVEQLVGSGKGPILGSATPMTQPVAAPRRTPSPMELDEEFEVSGTNFGKGLLELPKQSNLPTEGKGLLGMAPGPSPATGLDTIPGLGGGPNRKSLLGQPGMATPEHVEYHSNKKPLLEQTGDLQGERSKTHSPTMPRKGLLQQPTSAASTPTYAPNRQQNRPVLIGQAPPPTENVRPVLIGQSPVAPAESNRPVLIGSSPVPTESRPALIAEPPAMQPSTSNFGPNRKTLITDMSVLSATGTPTPVSAPQELYDPARPTDEDLSESSDDLRGKIDNSATEAGASRDEKLPYTPQQLLSILELLLEDRNSSLHSDSTKMRKALQLIPELQRMVRMGPDSMNKDTFVLIMQFVLDTVNSTVGGK